MCLAHFKCLPILTHLNQLVCYSINYAIMYRIRVPIVVKGNNYCQGKFQWCPRNNTVDS